MEQNLEEIKALLKKYNQEHLLNSYDLLDNNKKRELLNQIKTIDFELISHLYDTTKQKKQNCSDEITPMEYLDKYKLNDKYK